jgi:Ca-activated chloride channel family protein
MRPGFNLIAVAVATALTGCTPVDDPGETSHLQDQTPTLRPALPITSGNPTKGVHEIRIAAESRVSTGVIDVANRRQELSAVPYAATGYQRAGGVHMSTPGQAAADRENYAETAANGIRKVTEHPVSTLSIDVDTASYANVRRILNEGRLPPSDAVRVEEMINYFDYADPAPDSEDVPFQVTTELATTPWNADTRLLRIALRAWDVDERDLPPSNLVFLIDVSGSMNRPDKLPLLKRSLKLLTRRLDADDRVTLVVYAGAAGVVLEPTPGNERGKIEQALAKLTAGGSTHGSAGIRLAYAKAREAFIADGINRVILATDGDFNVGTVDHRALLDLVESERKAGVALTTLGFGRGNLNDHLMEQLADHGNGNAAYIDSLLEAQKTLVEQMGGTLYTIASDVKLQVEFNPYRIAEYRLIGYENRLLRREDFNNDQIDAGELGAGHSVVALFEIAESTGTGRRIDPLRYSKHNRPAEPPATADEFAYVKLRYKPRGQDDSRLMTYPITADHAARQPSNALQFSAAVAAFGQKLRGGAHLGDFGFDDIRGLARAARRPDENGYRADFIRLVGLADSLTHEPLVTASTDGSD